MNGVVTGVVVGIAGLGLFAGSVVGLLAATGRLTPEGVSNVPVLNQIVKESPEGEGEGAGNDGSDNEKTGVTEATAQKQKKSDEPAKKKDEPQVKRKNLFKLESFVPETTREEIESLYKKAQDNRKRQQLAQASVAKRELELSLREQDLEQRRKSIQDLMDKVTRALEELDNKHKKFQSEITLYETQRAENIKRQAGQLAVMEPEKAAEYLVELGPDREQLAVLLLDAMDLEAASAILGGMDIKRGARLIERATRLLKK